MNASLDAACAECGGRPANGENCASRFAELLALDHSRQEPWGIRHGIAFAVYTLQHSASVRRETLQQCWELLTRVYEQGNHTADVIRGVRDSYRDKRSRNSSRANAQRADTWSGEKLPEGDAPRHFAVTIADLGTFEADSYVQQLDAWCVATLRAWHHSVQDHNA